MPTALFLLLPAPAHAEEPLDLSVPGLRIGILVGPLMEDAARTYLPDSEYFLYSSYPDCVAALLAGKIDCSYDPAAEEPNRTVVRIKTA